MLLPGAEDTRVNKKGTGPGTQVSSQVRRQFLYSVVQFLYTVQKVLEGPILSKGQRAGFPVQVSPACLGVGVSQGRGCL